MAISYGLPENREFHFQRKHLKMDLNIFEIKSKAEKGSVYNPNLIHFRAITFTF